jgi:hypothetical protein
VEKGNILSVISTNVLTGKKTRFKGKLFADCSGDALLSRLAGAQTMYGRDAFEDFHESLAPEKHEKRENICPAHILLRHLRNGIQAF